MLLMTTSPRQARARCRLSRATRCLPASPARCPCPGGCLDRVLGLQGRGHTAGCQGGACSPLQCQPGAATAAWPAPSPFYAASRGTFVVPKRVEGTTARGLCPAAQSRRLCPWTPHAVQLQDESKGLKREVESARQAARLCSDQNRGYAEQVTQLQTKASPRKLPLARSPLGC